MQQTRLKNYQASFVLEGFQVSSVEQPLTKAQLLKNSSKTIK
ncbi:MAG: YhfG family protein [Acinetobacter populi]|nr:YhfG family protein [Acinetobacter populi]MCH4247490.1 YhfG family protein [Acinetobacter populi]